MDSGLVETVSVNNEIEEDEEEERFDTPPDVCARDFQQTSTSKFSLFFWILRF